MNEIAINFNGLNIGTGNEVAVSDIDIKETKSVKTTPIPKTDGSIAETARRTGLTISMQGSITGGNYDALRTNVDAFKAILQSGLQKFTLDDDRFIYAQLKDFSYSYKTLRTFANWSASFTAHFPYWQAEIASSDVRTPVSGSSYAISNPGNSSARAYVKITSGRVTIADDIKIENATNGQSFQYRGSLLGTGQILEIDNRYSSDDFAVLNNSADDTVNFEGDFLEIAAGTNLITYTGSAAGTVPEVEIKFRGAWL
jgi:hypothetical protein